MGGEQNIYWNTDMYVHDVQGQETNGLRRFWEVETGVDNS
jgi:hypothetical protein